MSNDFDTLMAASTVTVSAFSEDGAWLFDEDGEVLGGVLVDDGIFLVNSEGDRLPIDDGTNVGTAILRFTGKQILDGDVGFVLTLMGC